MSDSLLSIKLLLKKLYNKLYFKAFEVREAAVYSGINEDFEHERNAKITLLGNFLSG